METIEFYQTHFKQNIQAVDSLQDSLSTSQNIQESNESEVNQLSFNSNELQEIEMRNKVCDKEQMLIKLITKPKISCTTQKLRKCTSYLEKEMIIDQRHFEIQASKTMENKQKKFDEGLTKPKSQFSIKFIQGLRWNLKPMKVEYLNSGISKIIAIDPKMKAIEFVTLAIQVLENDINIPNNLLQFSSYHMAYRLMGNEENYDNNLNSARQSYISTIYNNSEEKQKNQCRLNSVACKPFGDNDDSLKEHLILVDNESEFFFFGFIKLVINTEVDYDLSLIKILKEQNQNIIIILVEDVQQNKKFHIPINKNKQISDIFPYLEKKFNKLYTPINYDIMLMYESINISCMPLALTFPINKLPIYYLKLQEKFQLINEQYYFQTDFQCLTNVENNFYIPIKSNHNNQDLSRLYSYQEFDLLKFEEKEKNSVRIGIDYYDIIYHYINEKENKNTFWKIMKQKINHFLQIEHNCQTKQLQISKIKEIKRNKEQIMIRYIKNGIQEKILIFGADQTENLTKFNSQVCQLNSFFSKLKFLLSIQRN